jgi:hypothetical protein
LASIKNVDLKSRREVYSVRMEHQIAFKVNEKDKFNVKMKDYSHISSIGVKNVRKRPHEWFVVGLKGINEKRLG